MPTADQNQSRIAPVFPGSMGVKVEEVTPEQGRRQPAGATRSLAPPGMSATAAR